MSASLQNSSDPARILVRGVNWLGDAVMSTPALLRLRERFDRAEICILTPQKLADLWRNHPAIDGVLSFSPGEGVWSVSRKLRGQRFELAVLLPNSWRSAAEVRLAGIPSRVGYAGQWRHWLLTTPVRPRHGSVRMRKLSEAEIRRSIDLGIQAQAVPADPAVHQSHEYLHLVSALGCSNAPRRAELALAPGEAFELARRLGLVVESGRPVLGLSPGAEYGPAKRWPRDRFIEAAIQIQQATHCRLVLFGGERDRDLCESIAAGILNTASQGRAEASETLLNYAGKTSLRELMAVLSLCRVVLTNDTGPMHVAAALGTPVVALFGSTSPELTGPQSGGAYAKVLRNPVPCSPCFRRECPIDFRCMASLSVEQVVKMVLGQLSGPGRQINDKAARDRM